MTNPFRREMCTAFCRRMFMLLLPTTVAPVPALQAGISQKSNLRRCLITGAAALMWLLMAAGTLSADTFSINVTFAPGLTGTGSFNTDGTCDPCHSNDGQELTNFVFTVDDDTFTEADAGPVLTYSRVNNTLVSAGSFVGGDEVGVAAADSLEFLPGLPGTTQIFFGDTEDTIGVHIAFGTVSAVPEPASILLLITVVAVTVFSARRRLRGRVRAS